MATGFLILALMQCRKHNAKYAITRRLLFASFAEVKTGQIVAPLVLGGVYLLPDGKLNREGFALSFDSEMHDQKIDLLKFTTFLEQKTKDSIDEIRQSFKVEKERDLLTKIMNGCIIWNRAHPEVETAVARLHVLSSYCIQCATQHNCERNVKIGSSMGKLVKERSCRVFTPWHQTISYQVGINMVWKSMTMLTDLILMAMITTPANRRPR